MAEAGNKQGDVTRTKVVVEGPYGGPGHTIYSSFSAAVLIGGGSGVSYSLSVLEDLILKDVNNESRVRSIILIWSIRNSASLVPLLPTLSSLVRRSIYTPVRISVFYTGATGKKPSIVSQALLSKMNPLDDLPQGITLTAGRPEFGKIFDEVIQASVSLGFGAEDGEPVSGMIVGVCGPVKLADVVSKVVSSIDPLRRDQVGGVELCEEVFGW
jgi:NAD(P)H-flavin reductase